MDAAETRRGAHAKVLKGKGGDVSAAEEAHAAALRAAVAEIRAILADIGHDPTVATLNAVTDTLQALPGNAPVGRLTEPLQMVGFEALAGLVPNSERVLRGLSPPPAAPAPKRAPTDAAAARHEAQLEKRGAATRRREMAATIKALRHARQDAKQAETALSQAQRALARARQERDRLQDQLQFAVKQIDDAASDVREREQRLAQAGQETSRLETRLSGLRESV